MEVILHQHITMHLYLVALCAFAHAEAEACPSLVRTSKSGNIRHRAFHFFRSPFRRCPASSTDAGALPTGILCGSWNCPHIASPFQAAGAVIGLRNCKTASRRSRFSSSKLNHNDKGSVCSHTGGMNRARAAFQKELSTKLSSHRCRQRFKAPGSSFEPYPIPVLADPKKIIRALAQLRDLKSFVSADAVNTTTSPQLPKYVSAAFALDTSRPRANCRCSV